MSSPPRSLVVRPLSPLLRLRAELEREISCIPEGESVPRVLLARARAFGNLVAQDVRGFAMGKKHKARLRRELALMLPWPDEEHEPRLLGGFLDPVCPEPKVSIIIPVYGKLHLTLRCLVSLGARTEKTAFEIVVVDDASPDRTEEVLSRVPGIRYVRAKKNGGFIQSCNLGASEARAPLLHFLNNDTVVLPGFLDRLVETLERVPDAGLIGSKLIYPNFRLQEAGGIVWRDASATNFGNGRDPFNPMFSYMRDVDYASAASVLIERELFHSFGGFDEHCAPCYYEDTDLAFKAREAKRRVLFQPASRVLHFEGGTAGTDVSAGPKRYQVENQAKFRERWAEALRTHGHYGEIGARERDRRSKLRVLVMDVHTPKPDRDSGSVDVVNFLGLLRDMDCHVTFLPTMPIPRGVPAPNVQWWGGAYTESLQALGIECPYFPYERSVGRFLRERGREFDVVFLHRVRVADRFFDTVRRLCPQAKIIYNTIDLTYLREEREAAYRRSRLLALKAADTRRRELGVIARADASIVLSRVEHQVLRERVPNARIEVIPLVRNFERRSASPEGRADVLFVGGFRHRPNVDAVEFLVREIWPEMRRIAPGVRLLIAGSSTPEAIRDLESEDVRVLGHVADLSALLGQVRATIAPLRFGAGLKGKVAESLGHGVPCVTTSVGAEGSGLEHGQDILIAEGAANLARELARVYADDALWRRLSDAGQAFVEAQYSLKAHRLRYEALFRELGVTMAAARASE